MTIEELKNQIDHVLKDKKSSSQLYLVLKREDQYSLCRVDWNDKKTEPEIKQLFINVVEQKILSNDELELRELSRADNRGNVLYHYDYDTYPEIAWFSDFSIDAAVQDAEVFDGKTASCEGLFGYVIYIGTMNHDVVLFKKHYPVTLLRHGKNCLLFNSRRMEPIDADILRISGDFQLFKVGTEMYIRDLNIMEKWLDFDKILKKDAENALQNIANKNLIDSMEDLEKGLNDKSFMKNLARAYRSSPIFSQNISAERIMEFIEKSPTLKNDIRFNEDHTRICLRTKTARKQFLKILNDDYLHSLLTDIDYDTKAKDPIKP